MRTNGLRSGAYPLIQSAFYAEHRARLAILKIAVDHECAVETGKIAVPKIASGTFDYADLGYWILPSSFKVGLDESKSHKHFKRYPLFWQVFLWGFGGFYLKGSTTKNLRDSTQRVLRTRSRPSWCDPCQRARELPVGSQTKALAEAHLEHFGEIVYCFS